jgi:hypothetical protein
MSAVTRHQAGPDTFGPVHQERGAGVAGVFRAVGSSASRARAHLASPGGFLRPGPPHEPTDTPTDFGLTLCVTLQHSLVAGGRLGG